MRVYGQEEAARQRIEAALWQDGAQTNRHFTLKQNRCDDAASFR